MTDPDHLRRLFEENAGLPQHRDGLAYRHMRVLAEMLTGWALDGRFGPESSASLIGWAEGWERLAEEVGPDWDPPEPDRLSLLEFLAREALGEPTAGRTPRDLKKSDPLIRSSTDAEPREPGSPESVALAESCRSVDELERTMRSFFGDDSKANARTIVFVDGKVGARLMLVGEAPSAIDEEEGRPYAGLIGQFVDRMLLSIGHDRRTTCLSNVHFWRPPENRRPTVGEISKCLPFTLRLIRLVQPSVLVCMGSTAARSILRTNAGLLRLKGRWFELRFEDHEPAINVVVTYHPAHLIVKPDLKREAWNHLVEVKKRLDDAMGTDPLLGEGPEEATDDGQRAR